ncbi:MAG: response regulator, partial [bacterium]|nr:response regulator [bacterium]
MALVTILVVEDEQHLAELIRVYLEREGYKVLIARNGKEGLAIYKSDQPSLVLLDIMLPEIDGWQVCKEIRAIARTPIIMLTARSAEDDKLLGLELGADDYVTKPFSPR